MEIITWFGRIDQETEGLLSGEDADSMIEVLLGQPRSVPVMQPDLRRIALSHGYMANDNEYNSRLHDLALKLVRRQLLELTTAEQDLLQAMEALDDISQGVNLLDERLYEWSRLHSQEIVHGKDLAEGLCEDENMGTLAKAIQGLREARKVMENGSYHLCRGAGSKPFLPGGTGAGGKAHLQSREPAPPGRYAQQPGANHGC